MIEFTIYEWSSWIITLLLAFFIGYCYASLKTYNYVKEHLEKGDIRIK